MPLAFERLGSLQLFFTDVWCWHGRSLLRRGAAGFRAFATRYNAGLPAGKVNSFNRRSILRRAWLHFRKSQMSPDEQADFFVQYGEWFATQVRDRLARQHLNPERDCFFGFNTNSLETLELLKQKKIFTIVDQIDPGRVEEDMVLAEAKRWPGWEEIPGRLPETYWQRLRQEWELADAVLVNSEWSRDALIQQGIPARKIMVVPLAIHIHPEHLSPPIQAVGKLKVIWLGSVILRKGIQYLIEAARLLADENIEFIVAGPIGISTEVCRSFPANVKLLGRVTRDQLTSIYEKGHVFVLPTVSDGFAITQLEAMAHGLPVIATPNCGRVVTDGVDGLVVPTGDGAALAAALARLNSDRPLIADMSRNALETIKQYDLPSNGRAISAEAQARRFGKNSCMGANKIAMC